MTNLFFLVLSCMSVTVWMRLPRFDLTCTTQEQETITNVTWYCDQENGVLTCKDSLRLGCRNTYTNAQDVDVAMVTDQSVLGLQHAGHGRPNTYDMSCKKENEQITNVTWNFRQENGKLSYQPSLTSCSLSTQLHLDLSEVRESDLGVQQADDRESDLGVQQAGASLTRIKAQVADEAWAGTDCAVKLILRNRDEPLTCQTITLDGAGDSWERDQVEEFKEEDFREEFLPCKHFYPKPGKLQFKFTCSDSMKLASVELDFGGASYSSQGLKDLDWAQWTDTWHNLY